MIQSLTRFARFTLHNPSIWPSFTQWRRNAQTRRHLAQLPPHLLPDVGLTPIAAHTEARRWFWQD